MDENTKLSLKRTRLASLRTLLSYIRTALLSFSVAIAFVKLDSDHEFDGFTIAFITLGGVFLLAGIISWLITNHAIKADDR